ncbi:hypothetical protein B0H14DRAFT_3519225 [Mycena olivaceomarginata]|nr:hypothetical protein B0H14DRAFT_3519225 [Mycena olivaceomarginata]
MFKAPLIVTVLARLTLDPQHSTANTDTQHTSSSAGSNAEVLIQSGYKTPCAPPQIFSYAPLAGNVRVSLENHTSDAPQSVGTPSVQEYTEEEKLNEMKKKWTSPIYS